ncbi:MAG: response regulator [Terriglobales bacterium]
MNRTVLIVDPAPVMRRVVERSLRLAGLEMQQVFEASDGQEALNLVTQQHPGLVLSELALDGVDGLQLLRQIRSEEATRTLPLVFVSSQAGEAQVNEALELGAQGYIRKPFTADQIKEYILPLFA